MVESFYSQSWFWTGLFTLAGSLIGSLGTLLIKEWITSRTQLKIERLKIYESDLFIAHSELYKFIDTAYTYLYPPNNPAHEFQELMEIYSKSIRKNLLYYTPEIRTILHKLDSQHACLRDHDLIPEKPFNDFYKDDLSNLLTKLKNAVEQRTDLILHKYKV